MQGETTLTTSLCQDSSRIWSEVSVWPFFSSCPVPVSRTRCSLKSKRIMVLCTYQEGIHSPTWSLPDGKSLFLCFPTMGNRQTQGINRWQVVQHIHHIACGLCEAKCKGRFWAFPYLAPLLATLYPMPDSFQSGN